MSQKTMQIFQQCSPIFSTLQDSNRQHIIILLFDNNELNVTEITDKIPLSRPAVSHHLKLLYDVGLINVRKEGKERYYRVELNKAIELLNCLLASINNDYNQQIL